MKVKIVKQSWVLDGVVYFDRAEYLAALAAKNGK